MLTAEDPELIRERFCENYARFFSRAVDGLTDLEIEVVTWSVKATDQRRPPERTDLMCDGAGQRFPATRPVFDAATDSLQDSCVVDRQDLNAGDRVVGPAIIVERETSTVVTTPFDAGHARRWDHSPGTQGATGMSGVSEIRIQIMWNRLISVVEEQAMSLLRTAFSTSVREAGDLSGRGVRPAGFDAGASRDWDSRARQYYGGSRPCIS